MIDRVQLLIDILYDKRAREDERGDAAIDLRRYQDLRALSALIEIASDRKEDDVIIDNCAESIGELCVNMNWFNELVFMKLSPCAQKIVFGMIMSRNPALIKDPFKTEFLKRMR